MCTAAAPVSYGCSHYKRRCQLLCSYCLKKYTCRFCHDESEDHILNRKEIDFIVCLHCETIQKVCRSCKTCGIVFGKYFCAECRLFDDTDKQQFHCDECGICRVGGEENYFHCPRCDICLNITLIDNHLCVEKASQTECSVCLENMHTSTKGLAVPKCGHIIHEECIKKLKDSGVSMCPTCRKAI